tara:strand:- start:126 stop:494 length:369 start_codon:yes stop_codon:yes gene_type:complete
MTDIDSEVDNLIVNLKVLSGLEQNKKLITKESFLNVETTILGLPESVRRFWRGDSRDESIKKIDSIVTKSLELVDEYDRLREHIESSKKGITNLKETYSTCEQTKARLDTIIFKIDYKFTSV